MLTGKLKCCLYVVVFAVLSGCATGPKFADAVEKIPAVSQDKGRIFVYRNANPLMALFQRVFTMDGKDIADVFNGTSFYHDTTPGSHTVSYNTPKENLKFSVPAGGSVYLKYTIGAGSTAENSTEVRIVPEVFAKQEIIDTMLIDAEIRTFIPKK